MFFIPYIGPQYAAGFNGYRTMVLGGYHYCLSDCPHKSQCASPLGIVAMDYHCPLYASYSQYNEQAAPYDQMCLHNSNGIELDAFINDYAGYPFYTTLSKYLLRRRDALSVADKQRLWDRLAFTNLLQCYNHSKLAPAYAQHRTLYDDATCHFVKLLAELKPQVLYVAGAETNKAILSNIDSIDGLRQVSLVPDCDTIELYKYTYNCALSDVNLGYIERYISACFPSRAIVPTAEGLEKHAVALTVAVANAVKRGTLLFAGGELVINPAISEQEGRTLLDGFRRYYTLHGWNDIEIFIKKYDKAGRRVKDLRKLRPYSPRDAAAAPQQKELYLNIFGAST